MIAQKKEGRRGDQPNLVGPGTWKRSKTRARKGQISVNYVVAYNQEYNEILEYSRCFNTEQLYFVLATYCMEHLSKAFRMDFFPPHPQNIYHLL